MQIAKVNNNNNNKKLANYVHKYNNNIVDKINFSFTEYLLD